MAIDGQVQLQLIEVADRQLISSIAQPIYEVMAALVRPWLVKPYVRSTERGNSNEVYTSTFHHIQCLAPKNSIFTTVIFTIMPS